MKRIIAFVICLACLSLLLVGCARNGEIDISNKKIHTDAVGAYIDIIEVKHTDEGDVLVAVWCNYMDALSSVSNQEKSYITFGNAYMIEYFNGSEWESVLKRDFAVTEIACMLYGGETCEKDYDTQYFDLSREGTYRLICDFYVPEGDRVGGYETWVEFYVRSK